EQHQKAAQYAERDDGQHDQCRLEAAELEHEHGKDAEQCDNACRPDSGERLRARLCLAPEHVTITSRPFHSIETLDHLSRDLRRVEAALHFGIDRHCTFTVVTLNLGGGFLELERGKMR